MLEYGQHLLLEEREELRLQYEGAELARLRHRAVEVEEKMAPTWRALLAQRRYSRERGIYLPHLARYEEELKPLREELVELQARIAELEVEAQQQAAKTALDLLQEAIRGTAGTAATRLDVWSSVQSLAQGAKQCLGRCWRNHQIELLEASAAAAQEMAELRSALEREAMRAAELEGQLEVSLDRAASLQDEVVVLQHKLEVLQQEQLGAREDLHVTRCQMRELERLAFEDVLSLKEEARGAREQLEEVLFAQTEQVAAASHWLLKSQAKLTTLSLDAVGIGAEGEGVKAPSDALPVSSLTRLALSKDDLTDGDLESLVDGLTDSWILKIDLGTNCSKAFRAKISNIIKGNKERCFLLQMQVGSFTLTFRTAAGNVAAALTWPRGQSAQGLPEAIMQSRSFAPPSKHLRAWNLKIVMQEGALVDVGTIAAPLAQQLRLS